MSTLAGLSAVATSQLSSLGQVPIHPGPQVYGEGSPMNVVLVMIDDIGVDQVGCYAVNYPGESAPQPCTPNLDALAAQGLRFTNAWSSPVCSPTRAQIVTGKRTSALGVGRATGPLIPRSGMDEDEVTLGDLIPLNGFFGKWHLAGADQVPTHPLDSGFFPFAGTMWNVGPPPQDGPHYYDWQKYDGTGPSVQTFEYVTTNTTNDAAAWIDQLNASAGRWFVLVSYHASHSPYHCPLTPSAPNGCSTDWWEACPPGCGYPQGVCRSRAMTQALDSELGRLLSHVDSSDTAVIVVGDNGTEKIATYEPFDPDHAKATLHQGGINVPLIISAPGLASGDNHELVQVADLFTTVLDLTRTPLPPHADELDSVSLAQYVAPGLADPAARPRTEVVSEIFDPNFVPVGGAVPPSFVAEHHNLAIRDARFKLIESNSLTGGMQHQFYQLYDPAPGAPPLPQDPAVTPDPYEAVDLMPLQASWTPGVQAAYDALVARLASYERLPLTTQLAFSPALVVEASETAVTASPVYACGSSPVRVGWSTIEGGAFTARTLMDFDVGLLLPDTDVLAMELELTLADGFDLPASGLLVRALPTGVAGVDCDTLFGSVTGVEYGLTGAAGGPQVLTIALGSRAELDLEAVAAAGSGTFSLALIFDGEGLSEDDLRLDPQLSKHALRVTYGLHP